MTFYLKANGGPGYKEKRGEETIPWPMALELAGSVADRAVDMAIDFMAQDKPSALDSLKAALFELGKSGANADTAHPMRGAWEATRDAIAKLEALK